MASPSQQHNLSNPAGIVFGEGHHLPDASALSQLVQEWDDWHISEVSSHIAALPDNSDVVVRYVGAHSNAEQWISKGVRHLQLLTESGITIPPHRYVSGPMLYGDPEAPLSPYHAVYALTNRLDGRNLSLDHAIDTAHNSDVIAGQARYLQAVASVNEPEFMKDIMAPHQFTVTSLGKVILHDTGFDNFNATYDPASGGLSWDFGHAANMLRAWTTKARISPPEALTELQQYIKTRSK